MKDTILILNCPIEPPYGGIAKYMTFLLPRVNKNLKFIGITGRGVLNNTNNLAFENISLVQAKEYSPIKWIFWFIRYIPLLFLFTIKYRIPFRHAIKIIYYWLPESERIVVENIDRIRYIQAIDNPNMQGTVAAYLGKKYNIPFLLTTFGELVPHKDPVKRYDEYSKKFIRQTQQVFNQAYRIGSITKYCVSLLKEFNIDSEKVHLFYPVVDINKFSRNYDYEPLLQKYPKLIHKKVVLFVGQIQPRKAPHLIVEAISQIPHASLNDYRFVFVGKDHGYMDYLTEQIATQHLEEHCLLTGAVDEDELLAFYSLAEIFVFPTVSEIECLGLVFIQAMFSKCAVIASNISGVPEVIEDGVNGMLYTPGDSSSLRQKLVELFDHPEKITSLAEAGFNQVMAQFNEEKIVEDFESFYI